MQVVSENSIGGCRLGYYLGEGGSHVAYSRGDTGPYMPTLWNYEKIIFL